MSAESAEGITPPRRRGPFWPRALIVALGCTLVAGGVAAWWAGWPGAAESAAVNYTSRTAHPTQAISAGVEAEAEKDAGWEGDSADEPPVSIDDATKVVASFLKVLGSSDFDNAGAASAIEEVATGAILEEIRNSSQELAANGWTQHGESTVRSVTVLSQDLTDSPATMKVQACIDSSAIIVTDSVNVPITGEGKNRSDSALNIFTLQESDETWRVAARTFPDNPAC